MKKIEDYLILLIPFIIFCFLIYSFCSFFDKQIKNNIPEQVIYIQNEEFKDFKERLIKQFGKSSDNALIQENIDLVLENSKLIEKNKLLFKDNEDFANENFKLINSYKNVYDENQKMLNKLDDLQKQIDRNEKPNDILKQENERLTQENERLTQENNKLKEPENEIKQQNIFLLEQNELLDKENTKINNKNKRYIKMKIMQSYQIVKLFNENDKGEREINFLNISDDNISVLEQMIKGMQKYLENNKEYYIIQDDKIIFANELNET